jgi:hypothetical protein
MNSTRNFRQKTAGRTNLVNEAAEGNHGKAAVLDLGELITLEVLLVGALPSIYFNVNTFQIDPKQ